MLQISYGDDFHGISVGYTNSSTYIVDVYAGYVYTRGDFLKREVTDHRRLVIDPGIDVLQRYAHLLKLPSGFDIFLTHNCLETLAIVSSLINSYNCRLITKFDNSFYPLTVLQYSDSRSILIVRFVSAEIRAAFVGNLFADLLFVDKFGHSHFTFDRIANISEENRTAIHQLLKKYLLPNSTIYPANHMPINLLTYEELLEKI
jgi:hypothetical protein